MSGRSGAEDRWLASRWKRLNGPQRVAGIDLARGLAVIGMFASHLLVIDESFDWSDASTWVDVANGRSSILFATLAGVSIGLFTGGASPLAGEAMRIARLRLVVRAALLWLIGVLLILTGVPVYVILPAYAILFLIATALTGIGPRALWVLAAAVAVVTPWFQPLLDALPLWRSPEGSDLSRLLGWHYPFPVWIAFVVAGLALARSDVRRLGVQVWTLAAGAALATIGYGADAASRVDEPATLWDEVWTAAPHSSGILEVVGSGGFALAVIAASLLLTRTFLTWVVLPLRAVGAMPLTAYTAQLVAWAIVAAVAVGRVRDLAGFRDLDPFWPFTLWILVGCTAWALLVGRGPLEWAVDRVTRLAVRRR